MCVCVTLGTLGTSSGEVPLQRKQRVFQPPSLDLIPLINGVVPGAGR